MSAVRWFVHHERRVRVVKRPARGERGVLLPLGVILLSVGTLLVLSILPQISTMMRSGYEERENAEARYAAEAALNRVIADMVRGADAYPVTYYTTSPHRAGQPYDNFQITTSYTIPVVTVNDYTATVQISLPTQSQAKPSDQQNYVDPGTTNPYLATLPAGYAYLMRIYNVKAGTIQVNWAYSPSGISRLGIWGGLPTDPHDVPYQPGRITEWPSQHPILDTGNTPANVSYNRTDPVAVDPATDDSGGVYTIVFGNTFGNTDKTTMPFAPSGGTGDTWIYVKAYKDYLVTSTVGDVTVSAYLRQVPGYSEPPAYTTPWAIDNPSFITNDVYTYTWSPP